MAYAHYERLSALDATFLEVEEANAHMHERRRSTVHSAALRRSA